jgi:hypothetical protein
MRTTVRRSSLVVVLVALLAASCTGIVRVSEPAAGGDAAGASYAVDLDRTGRYVAFTSDAANLVPNDANGFTDVFVRDRRTGAVELVSVSTSEVQANGSSLSFDPQISDDARFVVFDSWASNLAPGEATETEPDSDVFVRDRATGTTRRLSEFAGPQPQSAELEALSGDGRVALLFGPDGSLYRVDTASGARSVEVSTAECGGTTVARIAAATNFDGARVLYSLACHNGPGSQATSRVFLKDRATGRLDTLWRFDFPYPGTFGGYDVVSPSLSADGRHGAWLLAGTYAARGETQHTAYHWHDGQPPEPVPTEFFEFPQEIVISPAGDFVVIAFANFFRTSPPPYRHVVLRDVRTGDTYPVTVNTRGEQTDEVPAGDSRTPALSGDGTVIAFVSDAPDLVAADGNGTTDVFVRGTATVLARPATAPADG